MVAPWGRSRVDVPGGSGLLGAPRKVEAESLILRQCIAGPTRSGELSFCLTATTGHRRSSIVAPDSPWPVGRLMLCSRFARAFKIALACALFASATEQPETSVSRRHPATCQTDLEMRGPAPGMLNAGAPYATAARQQADGTDIAEISYVYGLGVIADAF